MSEAVAIFARITPKPESMDAAREAVLGIIPMTRAEPGCRAFTLYGDPDGSPHLYLYEIWDDEAALAAHHAQPYTQAIFDRYRDWLAQPVEITRMRALDRGIPCSS